MAKAASLWRKVLKRAQKLLPLKLRPQVISSLKYAIRG